MSEDAYEDEDPQDKDSLKSNIVLENAHGDEDAQDEDSPKSKIALDEAKVVPGSVMGIIRNVNPHKYHEETFKMSLDEAHAIIQAQANDLTGIGNRGVNKRTKFLKTAAQLFGNKQIKTKSKFVYAAVAETGHKISSEKPAFFN